MQEGSQAKRLALHRLIIIFRSYDLPVLVDEFQEVVYIRDYVFIFAITL